MLLSVYSFNSDRTLHKLEAAMWMRHVGCSSQLLPKEVQPFLHMSSLPLPPSLWEWNHFLPFSFCNSVISSAVNKQKVLVFIYSYIILLSCLILLFTIRCRGHQGINEYFSNFLCFYLLRCALYLFVMASQDASWEAPGSLKELLALHQERKSFWRRFLKKY